MTHDVVVIHPAMASGGTWIDDFVESGAGYSFRKLGRPDHNGAAGNWHARGARTPLEEWRAHFRHAFRAMTAGADVVVANFPQLTFACCFWKILLLRRTRVVGWSFNFGSASRSAVAPLVGQVFRAASRLIVHSRGEVTNYARAFRLPEDLLKFVPLQRGRLDNTQVEDIDIPDRPYIIAMGSAGRDYATLFEAVKGLDCHLLAIAKPQVVEGLDIPSNVEVRSGLSLEDCWALAARSRLMVVPVAELTNAAGQVTFLAGMQMGLPLVATRCPGTLDYLSDEDTALMVEPFDPQAMRDAISRVLSDSELAEGLGARAYRTWEQEYSDEAAGRSLLLVLQEVLPPTRPVEALN